MTHAVISIIDSEKEKFLRGCVNQITKLVWQKGKRVKEESVYAPFQGSCWICLFIWETPAEILI